ncbi:zinc finger protein 91-like [Anneissia japonica]|uniref:zinc finger protein 91-like n=1 Tax=Anneissia japonica TaxID=1529436 RepID=UPI0014254BE3|nr:zinc finger protein 91-like [Anneissia japonica]
MDSGDSSGEDVFECGKCKERFFNYNAFKRHKKSQVCRSKDRTKTNHQSNINLNIYSISDISVNLDGNTAGESCTFTGIVDGANTKDPNVHTNNAEQQLNIEATNNIVDLAAEFALVSDIANDSCKSTTNNSQLIDHNYMFLQSNTPNDRLRSREHQTRSKDTICMLCSDYTINLNDHLEKQHMIANEKVQEFVSHYMGQFSSQKVVKKSSKCGKTFTCAQCKTVFKTMNDKDTHVCQKLTCTQCAGEFKNATLLENHNCPNAKNCEDCDCFFPNSNLYMKHVCSKPELSLCKQCKVQFLNRARMQRHNCCSPKETLTDNVTESTSRIRRCSLCQFSSVHSSLLLSHFRDQHMSDAYLDDGNVTKVNNEDDSKTKIKNEKIKCRRCKRTVLVNHLEKHRLKCQEGKGKICILCNHYSRDRHDFTIHVDTHKVWLDLDDVKRVKNSQSELEHVNETNQQTNMDCSTLSLEDVDKVVKLIKKDQEQYLLDNQLMNTQEATEDMENSLEEGDKQENKKDPTNTGNDESLRESRRNLNTRKCKSCGTFFTIDCLPLHMLDTHNKIKLFRCFLDTCLQVFSKLEKFDAHVKSHPENEDMLWCGCKTCVRVQPSGLAKRKELRKEKMRQYYHNMMYKCETCWSKFPTEAGLSKHKRNETHHYPCHVCGKIQVSVRQLKMHILTHDTARHHLCDICGLGYKTSRDLKKHRLNHSDVRPYVCDSCGKAFPTKFKLNRHILCVHNPVKAFACTHEGCERKFSRKDKLKDHLNTHLEVEPFKCTYCSKGFYRSDNLRDHEVLHTRNYRFKCNLCSKGYMRPKLLEVHKQREHSEEADNQNKEDTAFPLYTLYAQQQAIQILPEAIQSLSAQTVQQLQQVVNEQQHQQVAIDVQYHQQAMGNPAIMPVFDSLQ